MDGKTQELVQAVVDGTEGAETELRSHLDDPGSRTPELLRELLQHESARVRLTAASAAGRGPLADLLSMLLETLAYDDEDEVALTAAESADFLMPDGGPPVGGILPPTGLLRFAWSRLDRLGSPQYPALSPWLEAVASEAVDSEALAGYGADLTAQAVTGSLSRAYEVETLIETIITHLESDGSRSSVLLGEAGSGKTAVVNELVHRLCDPGREKQWHVLRIAPSDFLIGTSFLGEWESKLSRLIEEARWPRRVLIYVPGIHELSSVGRSTQSQANIAMMLAPHIESGAIALLGESTPGEYSAGLGRMGSLRRLFTTVDVPPADAARTRRIVELVAEESGADWTPENFDRFLDVADYFFASTAQPGRAVGLFRQIIEAHPETREEFSERAVLQMISVSTGIPVQLLDDEAQLDISEIRAFFETRVMGQAEAVNTVLDLVTLIKAGLNDPMKPFGVLFFVGPTGVGKTELARTLAEYVFGDGERLVRFDMSEFASFDAFERLIGKGYAEGLLTTQVREKPLCVILLDEIEKAHLNIFDLCLQIFDAGRLTDGQGLTADFRRTIIILTSNVGSVVPQEESFGFTRETRPPPDRETTLKEVYSFFRPEFLNRLDRIVVFKPLSPQTAEKIARRELADVMERSGITRRSLSVDVDSSVISLLLRRGYSPAFGARPLKRTIEQLVLMPVARTIASGRAAPGAVLRLTASGEHVEVMLSQTEGEEPPAPKTRRVMEADDRLRKLMERQETLEDMVGLLSDDRNNSLARSSQPEFWQDRDVALETLEEIRRADGLIAAVQTIQKRIRGLVDSPRQDPRRVGEILGRLEREVDRIEFLLRRCGPGDMVDAILTVSLVQSSSPGLSGVQRIARMYAAYARRRDYDIEVIDDRCGGEPSEDTVTMVIGGVGAYGILKGETGLHHVLRTSGGRHRPQRQRDVIRVEVLPVSAGPERPPEGELKVETSAIRGIEGRLDERPRTEVSLLHLPSMLSVRAWTPVGPDEAPGRVMPLLLARRERDAADGEKVSDPMIRRYTLGPTPIVRDQRTGRTARLATVLEGDLGQFLTPPGE